MMGDTEALIAKVSGKSPRTIRTWRRGSADSVVDACERQQRASTCGPASARIGVVEKRPQRSLAEETQGVGPTEHEAATPRPCDAARVGHEAPRLDPMSSIARRL